MPVIATIKRRVNDLRHGRPVVDHALRTVEHYGKVNGSLQAGAVTYFAFLSFFPILALSFAVVGWVARVYPDAEQNLVDAINQVLPGIVGDGDDQVQLSDIESAAPGIFSIGLLTLLYSGLGWLSGMRTALLAVFEQPAREHPNFLVGKLRDLVALVALGVILMLSVAVSGVVTSLSKNILEALDLGLGLEPAVWVLAVVIGLVANTVLFFVFFRLLGEPDAPARSLWSGALLGAVGFEVLKQLSRFLLSATASQPAFQAFGIALVLVVWINYFSRVVVYAASWAHTSAEARAVTDARRRAELTVEGPSVGPAVADAVGEAVAEAVDAPAPRRTPEPARGRSSVVHDNRGRIALVAGGSAALALAAVLRRRKS
ncbi:YihY/virulence factor BrkB family protein [Nocardioides sp. LHG3406-4]|uniref:YihY/virulence factor BrkB family protein n=1 Tax=Nocardioides sp. LHG3406-4 TaxID=2804575 RepID=UPI003CF44EBF